MIAPADDLDRIMAVMAAAFDPAFGEAWTRRQVEDALVVGQCHYGLVDAAGQTPDGGAPAAGFYLARTGFAEDELLLLAVDPAVRRRGLGMALLERFARAAREHGSHRLLLEMRSDNPARALYSRFGFTEIGIRREYYRGSDGQRRDAITFARDC